MDVEVDGDAARVWLLTNDAAQWDEYQVNFRRERGTWVETLSAGGFQTGTPDQISERVARLKAGLRPARTEASP